MKTLPLAQCQQMLLYVAQKMIIQEEYLNKADSLGDSDHGTGMRTGFSNVIIKLKDKEFPDLASLFNVTGLAIMMSAGGSSGVIFGEMFKGGAHVLTDQRELSTGLFSQFLAQSAAAIMKRGGKQRGEKTMLDSLLPAVEYGQSEESKTNMVDFFYALHQAAKQGSNETTDMLAGAGRMQTLGERARGQVDPGSISVSLIFLYMYQFVLDL